MKIKTATAQFLRLQILNDFEEEFMMSLIFGLSLGLSYIFSGSCVAFLVRANNSSALKSENYIPIVLGWPWYMIKEINNPVCDLTKATSSSVRTENIIPGLGSQEYKTLENQEYKTLENDDLEKMPEWLAFYNRGLFLNEMGLSQAALFEFKQAFDLRSDSLLGELLEGAALLDEMQVTEILQEQAHQPNLRFGEIVVSRGWLKLETIEFFLGYQRDARSFT